MTEHEQIKIEIKKLLNSYRSLNDERRQIADELARLDDLLGPPSSSKWGDSPRGSGSISRPVEQTALKRLELEQRYSEQLVKLTAAQIRIEDIIEGLEPTERRLARFRYIDGLSWESVCDRMSYSWRQTHRIHSRILNKLAAAQIGERPARQPTAPAPDPCQDCVDQDCHRCRYGDDY